MHERFSLAKQSVAPIVVRVMLVVFGLLSLSACNSRPERPAPPTFPVTGKVVPNSGRMPVGGCVEFKPNKYEVEFTAMGVIDAEGKFKLKVPYVDRSLPGATEGAHTVRVILPLSGNGYSGGVAAVEGTFMVQPSENDFTIKMP